MLLKNENQIIRVLKSHGDKALVIDCIKRTMPKWIDGDSLSNYDDCGEDEMYERTDYPFGRELTQKEERIAQERFTMIAGVLPYIGNEPKRNQMIDFLAEPQSKQTIRKYLCLYLVYQDIDALAPPPKAEKELTQDERNMRWALNKFFYTKHKNSLNTAYTLMLKEKYCDQQGQLVAAYPTFDQFRYFYRKTKKMQQYYISRDGIAINLLQKKIEEAKKSEVVAEQIDHGNEALRLQRQIQAVNEAKLDHVVATTATSIRERHTEAANEMRNSLESIAANCKEDKSIAETQDEIDRLFAELEGE